MSLLSELHPPSERELLCVGQYDQQSFAREKFTPFGDYDALYTATRLREGHQTIECDGEAVFKMAIHCPSKTMDIGRLRQLKITIEHDSKPTVLITDLNGHIILQMARMAGVDPRDVNEYIDLPFVNKALFPCRQRELGYSLCICLEWDQGYEAP